MCTICRCVCVCVRDDGPSHFPFGKTTQKHAWAALTSMLDTGRMAWVPEHAPGRTKLKASQSQKTLIGSQRKRELAIFTKPPKARKHYRIAAKAKICYFAKLPKARKHYEISAKWEFAIFAKPPKTWKHYRNIGITIPVPYKTLAKMRILNASEALKRREHKSFGTLSVVRYHDAARVDI